MVDARRETNTNMNQVPSSGTVAIAMGAFSIIFFAILSVILTIAHNLFF